MDAAALDRIETQRLELESNVVALRKSLRYWQTIEIDYEGLKEEYQGLPESASAQQCLQAATDFKPELVDDAELQDILRDKQSGPRKPSQLVDILTKRSEYVLRNIATIRKQISNAEKKRNALLLAENPDYQDDAGLPLKEITEELDDTGEVISSKIQAPGESAESLIEVLRKAGVPDAIAGDQHADVSSNKSPEAAAHIDVRNASEDLITQFETQAENSSDVLLEDISDSSTKSDDIGDQDYDTQRNSRTAPPAVLGPTNSNDTEEDARLRQEMLQYGLDEVGAIVAELDMQEGVSDVEINEYMDDLSDFEDEHEDDDEDTDMSDGSEDERGASRTPLMSDRYVRRMEKLQKKLGLPQMQNTGPDTSISTNSTIILPERPSAAEAARKAALARADQVEKTKSSLKKSTAHNNEMRDSNPTEPRLKKAVAFANDLDIADETKSTPTPTPSRIPDTNPLRETIVEKNIIAAPSPSPTPSATAPPKKLSRFKASLSPPTPPQNTTIAPLIIEHPSPSTDSSITHPHPPSETDIDTLQHRREVALEYQRLRNRRVHASGGYVMGGEEDNWGEETRAVFEVGDDAGKGGDEGMTRRVSRFKAARSHR